MATPPFGSNEPEPEGRPAAASRSQKEPEPTPAQMSLAKEFLVRALKSGPRLTREVEQEAKQEGIAKRTLDRARSDMNVQRLPPDTFRGPWKMALKDDVAVTAYKQRKANKNQKARERQGNGRRRKQKGGGDRKQRHELLAPAR